MTDHDHSYKHLFSHPKMVEDLLKGFVHQDWVSDVDFSTLEKLNNSYISDDFRERSDDLVWRVKFKEQWLYVYLVLEFQSTIDPWMAVRLLTYVGLLYQDLIKTGQLTESRLLPPVFPIVLYNGARRWNAAETISDLIDKIGHLLFRYRFPFPSSQPLHLVHIGKQGHDLLFIQSVLGFRNGSSKYAVSVEGKSLIVSINWHDRLAIYRLAAQDLQRVA